WVKNPTLPLDQAVAMLNMDMIGRIKDEKVYIGGLGTGTTFQPILDQAESNTTFKYENSPGGYSSSDHTSFVTKRIPVLFFFSGLHSDYHKPSDTWDKINAPGAAHLLDLVSSVALRIDSAADRPTYVAVENPNPHAGTPSGGGGGYGPYFGSIPDFGQIENGVRFQFGRSRGWSRSTGRSRHRRRSARSEEHTSELQSRGHLVCRLLLE